MNATPENEDPVALLQAAARDYIPIDPNNKASLAIISSSQGLRTVPEPADRPTIESALEEIRSQDWYAGQIAYDRTVDAKDGQTGWLCAQYHNTTLRPRYSCSR